MSQLWSHCETLISYRHCWSYKAPLGILYHISSRGEEEFIFSTAGEVENACSVLNFSFPLCPCHLISPISKVQPCGRAVAHTQVKVCPSGSCRLRCRTKCFMSASPAPLKEFNTNCSNWTSMVKETWTFVVYYTYELLLPSYEQLVLCLC